MFNRVVNMHLGIAFITDLFEARFPTYCQPVGWFHADCDLLKVFVTCDRSLIHFLLLTIALVAVVTRVII